MIQHITEQYIFNSIHRHLGGKCENGKFCHFQHEPKLPPAELNVLRHKARTLPCKDRYCEDIDCCKYKAFLEAQQGLH